MVNSALNLDLQLRTSEIKASMRVFSQATDELTRIELLILTVNFGEFSA